MGKLVLVCEDDRPILEVTRTTLEHRDIKVMMALDCDNIIEKAIRHKPDLILMDVWLPASGGEKATIELKKTPATKHIPVLLFSALSNLDKITKSCGADGFIRKPFELEELIDKVEQQLDLRKPSLNQ